MPLPCPRCDKPMDVHRIHPPGHDGSIAVDRCGTCGGVWMDEGEANTIAPVVAHLDKRHIEIIGLGKRGGGIAECPRCHEVPFAFRILDIELDYCGGCCGVWLDDAEADAHVDLERSRRPLGERGPYRAIRRAVNVGETTCVGCEQVAKIADMYMATQGLVCRQCYASALNRAQDRRAAAVAPATSIVGGLIESFVNAFAQPPPRSFDRNGCSFNDG